MKKSQLRKIIRESIIKEESNRLTLNPEYDGGVGGMQKPPTAMADAILNGEESAMINRFKDYIKKGTGKSWDEIPDDIVQGFIQQYTNEVEQRAVERGADTLAFFTALSMSADDIEKYGDEFKKDNLTRDAEAISSHALLQKINNKQEWEETMQVILDLRNTIQSVTSSTVKSFLYNALKNL